MGAYQPYVVPRSELSAWRRYLYEQDELEQPSTFAAIVFIFSEKLERATPRQKENFAQYFGYETGKQVTYLINSLKKFKVFE